MKAKIGLIELKSHHEVLRTYLLGFVQAETELYCYTNAFNYNLQKDLHQTEQIHWRLISKEQSTEEFILQQQSEMATLDYLLITTIFPLANRSLLTASRTGLLIHGFHLLYRPLYQLFSFSEMSRLPMRLLKAPRSWGQHLKVRQWIKAVDDIVVGAQSVLDYLQKEQLTGQKPVQLLELYINESTAPIHQREQIQICVPGNINTTTRDYDLLFRVFKQLTPELLKSITLVFLGVVKTRYARSIKKQFQQLAPDLTLVFFDRYLNQETYDQYLQESDFLICPIKRFTYSGMVQEVNASSHLTANVNDAIRLGIPAIFPTHYQLPDALKTVTDTYADEKELLSLLEHWLTEKSFNHYKNKMEEALQYYNAFNTGKRFSNFLNQTAFLNSN